MRTRVVLILLAGSLALSSALAQSIEPADLQHHRWVLEAIDAEPLPEAEGGKIPELDFGEQMTVSGNFGNEEAGLLALLLPGVLAGLGAARFVRPHIDRPEFRQLVLVLALLGGAALVVRTLL